MVEWFSGNSGENEKRGIPLKVFPFLRKMSSGKVCSIWFPTGKTDFSIQMESAQNFLCNSTLVSFPKESTGREPFDCSTYISRSFERKFWTEISILMSRDQNREDTFCIPNVRFLQEGSLLLRLQFMQLARQLSFPAKIACFVLKTCLQIQISRALRK